MTTRQTRSQQATKAPAKGEQRDAELETVSGGSQSTGSGAGKITFNPFSITRKTDIAST